MQVPDSVEGGVAVAFGPDHGIVLLSDATLARWGSASTTLAVPPTATNVVAVAAGRRHGLAARADGSLITWGENTYGQRAAPPSATNIVGVAAGDSFSAALKSDGTVLVWGTWFLTDDPTPIAPADLAGVASIKAGDNHVVCLLSNGTVRCFGLSNFGQSDTPEGLANVKAISAGADRSLALRNDGTVMGWGNGLSSGSVLWSGIKIIGSGWKHDLGVRNNGSIVGRGDDLSGQLNIPPGLSNILAIGGGAQFSVALMQSCPVPVLLPMTAIPGTNICAGTQVTLTQAVQGDSGSFVYQWLRNGSPIGGATTSVWTVENPEDDDQYACGVTASCGASNILEALTINLTPVAVAPDMTIAREAGVPVQIVVVNNAQAAAGITVTGISGGSPSATITFNATSIVYSCPATNAYDSFTYTLGTGPCAATGTIHLTLVSPGGWIEAIERNRDGVLLRCAGAPNVLYTVQKSATADFQSPSDLSTSPMPPSGRLEYTDPDTTGNAAFYRLVR